ncbi:MAG TPA: ACP S-malonyltransferase [Acidimicrobiia bacterium]|jgi:[acyl-carrier-protein] S-malonyltransferase
MPYAILFPGQGSQYVGMGADVFAAMPHLFGGVDSVLGWSLAELCAAGPEDELTATDKAQPALYAVSYALWDAFLAHVDRPPAAAAGHSLGEYTALAAAGAFDFLTGLALVAARGKAMAAAGAIQPSGMAALVGADEEAAEALAAARRHEGGKLWVANLNAPGQVVVAGGSADIAWAVEHGGDHGIRRVVPLKVSGAFHSPLMAPAADELRAALEGVDVSAPAFPVWANATARPVTDVAESLANQLVGTVRFAESLQNMADAGIDVFVHIGPGEVTAGLARRTLPDAVVVTVSSLDDVEPAMEAIG